MVNKIADNCVTVEDRSIASAIKSLSSKILTSKTGSFHKNAYRNKRKAFSVAEAFIVLLIGSIALGMSAPMITKQIKAQNMADAQLELLKRTIIPRGAIMFFDLDDCPEGWSALNSEGAFIRDVGGEADARGVVQESGVPNLKGWNGVGDSGKGDGTLFKINKTIIGGDSGDGSNDFAADFDASRYSTVYKDGLNEVRPKNIAYLACRRN